MMSVVPGPPLRVGRPRTVDGAVTAEADDVPLWFRCADAPLEPVAEGFASALLIPAAAAGRPLALDAPLDPRWRGGAKAILDRARTWWGFEGAVTGADGGAPDPPAPARSTALCFSGGVDSLWTLLRGPERVDLLLHVTGYDVRLHEADRAAAVEEQVRAVAAEAGIPALVLETNLRDHPAADAAPWNAAHGGALAAAGHVLAGTAGRLLISASFARVVDQPWGSRWDLDQHWSSARLEVVHVGDDLYRSDKLRQIAAEPLVRDRLRVCWEHRSPALNCSRCEKCVRTMAVLCTAGRLEESRVFDRSVPLADRIDALPETGDHLAGIWAYIVDLGLPRRERSAALRLLRRSGVVVPWWRR
jgi:hypothetical protein